MPDILKNLKDNPYLKLLGKELEKFPQEVFLVGGALRDLYLGRKKEFPDFDFAVSKDGVKISRQLAKKLNCPFVLLDKEHASTRVILRKGGLLCNFDFTDFRGKTIGLDLLHRDFTVNAMAVNLRGLSRAKDIKSVLLDPFNARKDIERKRLCVVSEFSIPEDPLRIMRAYSLSAVLGFKITVQTLKIIKKHKSEVPSCAFERITEELFKILNSPNAYKTFAAMDNLKLLSEIIPQLDVMRGVSQGPYHHLDVYKHSMQSFKEIEALFLELKRNKQIRDYLDQGICGSHKRIGLLKLGALLHDIGKPQARRRSKGKIFFHGHEKIGSDIMKDIALRLRLSNDEVSSLSKIIFWHLRPGYLADMQVLTKRAEYRYFRDTANEAVSILLLSIADQRSTRGPLTRGANRKHQEDTCLGLINVFFKKQKEKKMPKLINGDDLINSLKLTPGPLIGKILRRIDEAQATGEIKTKPQALAIAKKFIK